MKYKVTENVYNVLEMRDSKDSSFYHIPTHWAEVYTKWLDSQEDYNKLSELMPDDYKEAKMEEWGKSTINLFDVNGFTFFALDCNYIGCDLATVFKKVPPNATIKQWYGDW